MPNHTKVRAKKGLEHPAHGNAPKFNRLQTTLLKGPAHGGENAATDSKFTYYLGRMSFMCSGLVRTFNVGAKVKAPSPHAFSGFNNKSKFSLTVLIA